MAGASDRRKSGGGDSGGEGANWMDTYGDLVTLLLCFFVLLFAFSNIDAAKWNALVGSFTGVSIISNTPLSPEIAMEKPIEKFGPKGNVYEDEKEGESEEDAETAAAPEDDDPNIKNVSVQKMHDLAVLMGDFVAENGIKAEILVLEDEYTVKMVFNDMVFFNTAEAKLLPESLPILDLVIEMFTIAEERNLYELIRVEGHTDKRPIHTAQWPSNWELSAHRSLSVLSYMRDNSTLDTKKLASVGYGEERPLIDEDTPEAYAMNRRVEFSAETWPQLYHGGETTRFIR